MWAKRLISVAGRVVWRPGSDFANDPGEVGSTIRVSASVVDVLDAQHRRVTELFEQVSDPGADPPVVLQTLLRELAAHVAAERSEVGPVVKSRSIGGDDLAGQLVEDYDRIDRLMVLIERRKFNSPDLPELVTELKDAVHDHVSRAESSLFPGLDSDLSEQERAELGVKVSNADDMVTTHPHPHLLSLGPLSAKVTAFLSRFDWMRDRTVTNLPPSGDRSGPTGPDGGARGEAR